MMLTNSLPDWVIYAEEMTVLEAYASLTQPDFDSNLSGESKNRIFNIISHIDNLKDAKAVSKLLDLKIHPSTDKIVSYPNTFIYFKDGKFHLISKAC